MNPEIKAQWLAALRSGEYRQGKGELEGSGGRFCCLGVLCHLAHKQGVVERTDGPEGQGWYDDEDARLPYSVRDWSGMTSDIGLIEEGKASLVFLNDLDGRTFDQIADVIEKEF